MSLLLHCLASSMSSFVQLSQWLHKVTGLCTPKIDRIMVSQRAGKVTRSEIPFTLSDPSTYVSTLSTNVTHVLARYSKTEDDSFDWVACANLLVQQMSEAKAPGCITLGSFTNLDSSVIGVTGTKPTSSSLFHSNHLHRTWSLHTTSIQV